MSDLALWKLQDTTQTIRKRIQDEIDGTKEDLCNSNDLLNKEDKQIAKEYLLNRGYIRGLQFIEDLLKVENDIDE